MAAAASVEPHKQQHLIIQPWLQQWLFMRQNKEVMLQLRQQEQLKLLRAFFLMLRLPQKEKFILRQKQELVLFRFLQLPAMHLLRGHLEHDARGPRASGTTSAEPPSVRIIIVGVCVRKHTGNKHNQRTTLA